MTRRIYGNESTSQQLIHISYECLNDANQQLSYSYHACTFQRHPELVEGSLKNICQAVGSLDKLGMTFEGKEVGGFIQQLIHINDQNLLTNDP